LKPESKFWKEWKAFTPNILWTRIENMSSLGTPDLLGYNKNKTFFTVETLRRKKFIKELKSLQLVACSLMLAAWGLMLVACTLSLCDIVT
jgi:hypothetical protein